MTKTYFRFEIPKGLGYSAGWHGTLSKCPSKVEVILYNEQEGYGIAYTPDIKLSKEISVIEEAEALGTMTTVSFKKVQTGLYYGEHLYDKWINLQPKEISVKDSVTWAAPNLKLERAIEEVLDGR